MEKEGLAAKGNCMKDATVRWMVLAWMIGLSAALILPPRYVIVPVPDPVAYPAYSIDSGDYRIVLVDNLTEMQDSICHYNLSTGCTDQRGNIWIYRNFPNETIYEICNHEILHNVLWLPVNETEWGTSDEHQS